ncbi:hypothetical protein CL622_02070, partial [archaeon]|nr:hypothetical protein [archaeon]
MKGNDSLWYRVLVNGELLSWVRGKQDAMALCQSLGDDATVVPEDDGASTDVPAKGAADAS